MHSHEEHEERQTTENTERTERGRFVGAASRRAGVDATRKRKALRAARFTFACRSTPEAGLRWNPEQAGDEATGCSRIFRLCVSAIV